MRNQKRIAIHISDKELHFSNWANPWINFCQTLNLEYEVINCYSLDAIEVLKKFDVLLWHFSHYSKQDMVFARSILRSATAMGVKTFPNNSDSWHFDDKIAQDYYLSSIGSSIPKSRVFYSQEGVKEWLNKNPELPVVAKLRCGSGSQNVKLLKTKNEVIGYSRKMFEGSGFSTVPSLAFKLKSNVISARSMSSVLDRARKIPYFLNTLIKSRSLDRESGYLYIQELIKNDGFDLKIVVVGEKLSFIGRRSRGGDFRASGGGDLFYDRAVVTPQVIDLCFMTSSRIGSSCMGYDVVIDSQSGTPYIIEMSYGFSHAALFEAGGYWNRCHQWISEPINAPEEILRNIIS